MRVYLAGGPSERGRRLAERFGDEGVACSAAEPARRLGTLCACRGIWLPAGWRGDPRAVWEKEWADRLGIPRVDYFPP